jgi:hypothetical protein
METIKKHLETYLPMYAWNGPVNGPWTWFHPWRVAVVTGRNPMFKNHRPRPKGWVVALFLGDVMCRYYHCGNRISTVHGVIEAIKDIRCSVGMLLPRLDDYKRPR